MLRDVQRGSTSSSGPQDADHVTVFVRRSPAGKADRFTLGRTEPMKILDVLTSIQRDHDPSLGFRYSCRVAMCGTCGLRVNGTAVLACQTPVPADAEELYLEPLAGLPVIRDLVVDMGPFFERWAAVRPYLVPDDDLVLPARIPPDSPERQVIDPALDCITCGICYSACSVSEAGRDFLGPAALNRAMVLAADSRDAVRSERLARFGAVDGVDRCHYIGGCTASCPKGLDPFGAIVRLRRWRMGGFGDLEK
jgi:succinate dehydrogenase/fumarate reductase iron-sulfur protein